jgi:hypothetical protein
VLSRFGGDQSAYSALPAGLTGTPAHEKTLSRLCRHVATGLNPGFPGGFELYGGLQSRSRFYRTGPNRQAQKRQACRDTIPAGLFAFPQSPENDWNHAARLDAITPS